MLEATRGYSTSMSTCWRSARVARSWGTVEESLTVHPRASQQGSVVKYFFTTEEARQVGGQR